MKTGRAGSLALVCALLLGGCGGGGSDAPEPPPNQPACNAWPASLSLAETGGMITDVVAVSACSLLVSGHFGAPNPFEPSGDTKGFVLRLSLGADGVVREDWRHLLDSAGTDVVTHIELREGEIRYLGWSDGATPGHVAHGKSDVMIGVLDVDGNLRQSSRLGNERPNRPLRLFDVGAGAHVLIGNDDVYVPSNFVEAWEDPWIAAVGSSAGQYALQWLQRADTPVGDRYFAAMQGVDGAMLLARGADAGPAAGITFERRTADGTLLWERRFTQSPFDAVGALRAASPGTALVYGSSFQNLGGDMAGGADLFVAEVDLADGATRVIRQFGTPATDWATAMLVTNAHLYLVSELYPSDPDDWQVRLSRLSMQGEVLEERVLSDTRNGAANAATVIGGQLVVVGSAGDAAAGLRGWLRFVPLTAND
ncbi:MAG: hypothetical protein PHQ14_12325 [Chromatiales bacterium]|jgi:hypothetical protein|nr:hypothetical protein [Chromatiales bacterium]MDX9768571.1 hypothetical protein [Ectothiorhodospiraceae bacterium]